MRMRNALRFHVKSNDSRRSPVILADERLGGGSVRHDVYFLSEVFELLLAELLHMGELDGDGQGVALALVHHAEAALAELLDLLDVLFIDFRRRRIVLRGDQEW